jgi:hypothetical protein
MHNDIIAVYEYTSQRQRSGWPCQRPWKPCTRHRQCDRQADERMATPCKARIAEGGAQRAATEKSRQREMQEVEPSSLTRGQTDRETQSDIQQVVPSSLTFGHRDRLTNGHTDRQAGRQADERMQTSSRERSQSKSSVARSPAPALDRSLSSRATARLSKWNSACSRGGERGQVDPAQR